MAIAARDFRELKLDGMSRSFGSVNALKGVTLNVQRGSTQRASTGSSRKSAASAWCSRTMRYFRT